MSFAVPAAFVARVLVLFDGYTGASGCFVMFAFYTPLRTTVRRLGWVTGDRNGEPYGNGGNGNGNGTQNGNGSGDSNG